MSGQRGGWIVGILVREVNPSLKLFLRKLKRLLDLYVGKYLDTYIWRFRHYIRSDWKEGYLDANSLSHPHRELIVESIRNKPNINTILELGTGNGINLINLSAHYPEIKYIGIDINKKAILDGLEYIKHHDIPNINLYADHLFAIKKMESLSVDYVLTDAVLMYIAPGDLRTLFTEMLRVSKIGFLLCEQASSGSVYVDHWRHDYKAILTNMDAIKSYTFKKIPNDYWSGDWIKYGYLIEVEKYK